MACACLTACIIRIVLKTELSASSTKLDSHTLANLLLMKIVILIEIIVIDKIHYRFEPSYHLPVVEFVNCTTLLLCL